MGYVSKNGDSGRSRGGWDCTAERVAAAPPSPTSPQFPKEEEEEEERVKWEEVSAAIDFVAGHNKDGGGGGPGEVMVGGEGCGEGGNAQFWCLRLCIRGRQ